MSNDTKKIREEKVLSSKIAKKTMVESERMAKKVSIILSSKDFQDVQGEIRQLFDDNLGQYEYIGLIDHDGVGTVHTNRLREGMTFRDPGSVRAYKTTKPLAQVYYRDTGEIIIDCTCPVFVNGKHYCNLRVGSPLIIGRFAPKVFAAVSLPVLIPTIIMLFLGIADSRLLLWPVLAIALSIGSGLWINKNLLQTFNNLSIGMKRVSNGDLTYFSKADSLDDLSRFSFEINKVSAGIKNMVLELNRVATEVSQAGVEQLEATNSMKTAADQMASTLQEVAAGASNQTIQMTEAKNITDEIAASTKQMEETVIAAVDLATKTMYSAEKGFEAINKSIQQMESIRSAVETSSEVIDSLQVKSAQIGEIINAITDIADQTNLLALNAAIEAARAGEQGRGFAVVAEEVRKLAEQSSNSAQEIGRIISETLAKTDEAVKVMSAGAKEVQTGSEVITSTGTAIEEITVAVTQTREQIEANAALANTLSSKGQTLAKDITSALAITKQTAESTESLSAVSQEQAAMTNEIADSVEDLSKTAAELEKKFSLFKVK